MLILSATNLTRAGAYGVTLDAFEGYKPTGIIKIGNAASLTDESYSLGANNAVVTFTVSSTDLVNLTIDGVLLSGTLFDLAAMQDETLMVQLVLHLQLMKNLLTSLQVHGILHTRHVVMWQVLVL